MRPVSRWWWIINTAVCVYCFYKRSACLVPPPISPSYPLAASLSFRSLPLPCVLVLLFLPGVIRPAVSQLEVNAHVSPPSLLFSSLSLAVVFRRWSLSSHVRNHKETLTATFCTDAHFELRVHTDICREDLRDVCTLWMLRTFLLWRCHSASGSRAERSGGNRFKLKTWSLAHPSEGFYMMCCTLVWTFFHKEEINNGRKRFWVLKLKI